MIWTILLILPYSVIILIAWINLRKAKTKVSAKKTPDNSLPNVSVIVAAKNEEAYLPGLISDLQNQDYPVERLEIIIVDDHSSDSTSTLIKDAGGNNYILSNGIGKKQAIASGLAHAKGELIITTDADCRLNRNWLRVYTEKFISEKADLIIGQVKPQHYRGLLNTFQELEFYSLQAVTG